MAQLVPLNKRSKKAQKEYHARQRGSWYGLSPVTRTVPSGKVYDRNRVKQAACRALGEIRERAKSPAPDRTAVPPQEEARKVEPPAGHRPTLRLRAPPGLYGL